MHMTLNRRIAASAIGALTGALVGGAVILTPAAAIAAPGDVQVSADGVSFSNSYPGTLYGGVGHLVPGDSEQETFYLRNAGTEAGFLRVTLTDVVTTDVDFADALTLSASTVASTGTPTAISAANPCRVLVEGQRVNPGERVEVTTTLGLGDLMGSSGQGATAGLSVNVVLSSASAQLPPTSCGQSGVVVPVTPRPASQSQSTSPTSSTPVPSDAATPPRDSDTDLPVLNLPELLGIDPNTWRLFEEYFVFLLIGAFIVGTAWFGFVAWRRRKNESDLEPDTEAQSAEGTVG